MGQFFTPPDLARLTVALGLDREGLVARYRESGVISLHEPTIGSGVMVLAWAEAVEALGIPRSRLFVDG